MLLQLSYDVFQSLSFKDSIYARQRKAYTVIRYTILE